MAALMNYFNVCGAVFFVCLTVMAADGQRAFCGETPPVWRNYNRTCPGRAVCADVFKTHRDWYNGTSCDETRTLHNCMCPGGTVCPFRDPNHRLFASSSHERYVCNPICTLPWCGNVRPAPPSEGNRNREEPVIALIAEQNAEEFGGRTYYKMSCRCPRHHRPYEGVGRHRSVKAHRHNYNYSRRRFSFLYRCADPVRGREASIDDPCSP